MNLSRFLMNCWRSGGMEKFMVCGMVGVDVFGSELFSWMTAERGSIGVSDWDREAYFGKISVRAYTKASVAACR